MLSFCVICCVTTAQKRTSELWSRETGVSVAMTFACMHVVTTVGVTPVTVPARQMTEIRLLGVPESLVCDVPTAQGHTCHRQGRPELLYCAGQVAGGTGLGTAQGLFRRS